jgi:tetratricopeptide (TPR) repeat protein
MKWDWGNSGSDAIYHDTETRRNGITYRSTLSRLAEALIKEGKFDKAEKILDLGMEKMPVDKFEYYSLLEPFIEGYYQINKPQKARDVFNQVAKIYQEHLLFYSGWDESKQISYAEDIISDMERYRGLVDLVIKYDTEEYAKKQAAKFNDYLKLFRAFYDEDEGVNVSKDNREREIDSLLNLLDDSIN